MSGSPPTGTHTNRFDRLTVDVADLYRRFPPERFRASPPEGVDTTRTVFHAIYRNSALPFSLRTRAWDLCRRTNLDLTWFEQFREYWQSVLGGRPLWHVQDFHFLRNQYRIRFQDFSGIAAPGAEAHLAAWQSPEALFHLFHMVTKESTIGAHWVLKALGDAVPRARAILELGCGTAPFATALFDFFEVAPETAVYLADLRTVAFHYAAFKFARRPQVTPIALETEQDFLLPLRIRVDLVICLAVFEHLTRPLETARRLHRVLRPGGLLFFDYIRSEGKGLDTREGVAERAATLAFLRSHFDLVSGTIDEDRSVGPTLLRKPRSRTRR